MDIYEIIHKSGMSARPEFYSGRGAVAGDLPSKSLIITHKLIKQYHGDEAGDSFCQMLLDLPKLTATDFLIALFGFSNNWKWDKQSCINVKGIYTGDVGTGMMTLAGVLSGDYERDESDYIRQSFFSALNDKKWSEKFQDFLYEKPVCVVDGLSGRHMYMTRPRRISRDPYQYENED